MMVESTMTPSASQASVTPNTPLSDRKEKQKDDKEDHPTQAPRSPNTLVSKRKEKKKEGKDDHIKSAFNFLRVNKEKTDSRASSRDSSRDSSRNNSSDELSDDDEHNLKPRNFFMEKGVMYCGHKEEETQPHVLEGYLKKLGNMLGWRTRYFVLKKEEKEIIYFKKRSHYLEKRKPLGFIDLTGAASKKNTNNIDGKEHVFVVFFPDEVHGEVYTLLGNCEAQIQEWVSSINMLNPDLASAPGSPHPPLSLSSSSHPPSQPSSRPSSPSTSPRPPPPQTMH